VWFLSQFQRKFRNRQEWLDPHVLREQGEIGDLRKKDDPETNRQTARGQPDTNREKHLIRHISLAGMMANAKAIVKECGEKTALFFS
jgi:hypothetical protein